MLQGVELGAISVPLHTICLQSDFISGHVTVGLRPSLPVKGISLILGNDLAEDKVVVNPHVPEVPCREPEWKQEKLVEGLFPSCAITRAMAKAASEAGKGEQKQRVREDHDNIVVSDPAETSSVNLQDASLPETNHMSKGTEDDSNRRQSTENLMLSPQKLILDQEKDKDLRVLRQQALSEKEAAKVSVCYFLKNGVLMRKWRPPDVAACHEWKVFYQIVVPTAYRQDVLGLAHETPLAGHLGIPQNVESFLLARAEKGC